MSNPIDRALANAHRKLDNQNSRQCAEDFDRERRQILTDLAAEIKEKHCPDPGFCVASERLAAVREAKDRLRGSILAEELDAILDGKEAEDR